MVIDELARRWQLAEPRSAFGGLLRDGWPAGPRSGGPQGTRRVVLLTPQTYMNRSGSSAAQMVGFYKADPADLLVVLDDMALPPGQLRARSGGSAGGHKGLADVLTALGVNDVPRLRIGIGPPPPRMDAADFVLTRFGPEEIEDIEHAIQLAADAVGDWVFSGIEYVMQKYNRRTQDTGNADEQ